MSRSDAVFFRFLITESRRIVGIASLGFVIFITYKDVLLIDRKRVSVRNVVPVGFMLYGFCETYCGTLRQHLS